MAECVVSRVRGLYAEQGFRREYRKAVGDGRMRAYRRHVRRGGAVALPPVVDSRRPAGAGSNRRPYHGEGITDSPRAYAFRTDRRGHGPVSGGGGGDVKNSPKTVSR